MRILHTTSALCASTLCTSASAIRNSSLQFLKNYYAGYTVNYNVTPPTISD
jgi:hypothetical protein